ncbi:uncharacterized protein LOC118507840 isoform X1 [Anopheles stephensi]|uniref:uncharacterized protein LOC118507840 isoform X1 n=1 Tax=Anopheles stephensi TaxID=30069 RepID=UPI0016587A98|nr:uncharacterized protein LOC118507840 isoform X1 [Anopheles stephensi]XP_035902857.1 uncharacterized protein LOC118507840 isoform X1 [Anopheles stephensi]XP_035902858.1 uncharacterized protein LOC118507840 isoform X1 [Anopheles stephensi]XP_035902859.1 uncharacterized protein LOC118507840 isoform X1 [Anopheles stephensi]XP_035902860.1 uncharacterized protein LOC118507840 isoform X1 [Anopheles stephensi]
MQLQTLGYDAFWLYSISAVVMVSMITTVLSCLCCRRKQEIKNDLLGLEGMVKLTNPEDTLLPSGSTGAINVPATNNGNSALGTNSSNASNLRPASVGGGLGSDTESSSKRTSNAPHRSLPDIPIAEPAGDNNSELYATVGDKVQDLPQGRSPSASLKKQASVSQHSSISQADDISSPYARVRSPPHAYDKLRRMEHPYAQVAQPGSAAGSTVFEKGSSGASGTANRSKPRDGDDDEDDDDDELMSPISRRESSQNIEDRETSTVDIPAASAIAGRVSASQDLPYMTPPIVQPSSQHFSGDSQDSSKGYTSISVREPLANLLPQNMPNQTTAKRRQILGDSHYATVSDDSDEMYAAIDDPGNQGDLYTSGSETYAQIQPPNAMTVSVEINTGASSRPQPPSVQTLHATANDGLDSAGMTSSSSNKTNTTPSNRLSNHSNLATSGDEHMHGAPSHLVASAAPLEGGGGAGGLRAQTFVQHSRQASSSSCTSSVGNLGSPKPEKRQANSPLPPTPKTLKHQANNFFSTSNQSMLGSGSVASSSTTTATSGRNSVASVIECGGPTASNRDNAGNKSSVDADGTNGKQKKSPSKDLEGMYAKVMKKNKLSKVPSQNSSPVPLRKDGSLDGQHLKQQFLSDSDMSQFNGSGSLHSGSPSRSMAGAQRNSTGTCPNKDPGYETIPGDNVKAGMEAASRKSADYAQIQKLHRHQNPGTTTVANVLLAGGEGGNALSAIVAQGIESVSLGSLEICHGIDEHYERSFPADTEPGYESLPDTRGSMNDPGYETLNRGSNRTESDSDPNYEILRPAGSKPSSTASQPSGANKPRGGDSNRDSDGYSSIREPGKSAHQTVKNGARNRLDFGGARRVGVAEDDDTDSSTPGYSSIKEKDDYDPGYSVISERKNPPPGHDYASITEEAKKRKPNINNNLEPDDESDIYSSIPHTASGTLTMPSPSAAVAIMGGSSPPGGGGSVGIAIESGSNFADRTCTAVMGTLSSSPGYSSISETRTTPSSTDGDGDGSTSSPDQLIGYSKHNSNTNTTVTTNNSLSRISSNYESLTGSESDPNYESVKYLNVKENPYERLHNESGGGAGGTSEMESIPKSLTNDSLTTDSDTATPTPGTQTLSPGGIPSARRALMGKPDSDGTVPAVGDYFQV